MAEREVCMPGGHAWQGACIVGVCMARGMHGRGHAWQGGMHGKGGGVVGEMATAADGTHPTGMHSCLRL